MEFVPVQSFDNYVEAHMVMGNLQQQHINCWLKDEYTVTIDPMLSNAIGGIKLMVAKAQVPRAMELLRMAAGKVLQHIACPHCGSREIQPVAALSKNTNWFIQLIKILFGNSKASAIQEWHCIACGINCKQPLEVNTEEMQDAK